MIMRYRDLAARVYDDEIRFPAFLPNSQRAEGTDGILVNVYKIWTDKDYRRIVRKNVKGYTGHDGFILPESGWQQINKYEDDVTNEEIVETQKEMGFEIVAPLAASKIRDAILNARIAWDETQKPLFLEIPQHWTEKEVQTFVKETKNWAWGYGTKGDDIDKLLFIVKTIPRRAKLHVFGIHHPAVIPVLAAAGVDSFSSGAFSRYAEQWLYITEASIVPISRMDELPCSCQSCANKSPKELDYNALRQHNLDQFVVEIKRTRNAAKEGRLYEYAKRRALTHPRLWNAFQKVIHSEWVLENQPFPKQSSIYDFGDVEKRPEYKIGLEKARKARVDPKDLAYAYPFGQTYPEHIKERPEPEKFVHAVLKYFWGLELDKVDWKERHGIPRDVFWKGERIGLIRYEDGTFIPTIKGAKIIVEKTEAPKNRIVLNEAGVQRLRDDKTPLTTNAVDWDPELRPYQEIILVDENDRVVGTGKSMVTAREMREVVCPVVKLRHRVK